MAYVTYPEKAFLQLIARRVLNFRREAAARGETYNDLSGFSLLQCHAKAKFVFEPTPGGYSPAVFFRRSPFLSLEEYQEIAAEILEGPVKLRKVVGDDLEYVREMDAGVLAPE